MLNLIRLKPHQWANQSWAKVTWSTEIKSPQKTNSIKDSEVSDSLALPFSTNTTEYKYSTTTKSPM